MKTNLRNRLLTLAFTAALCLGLLAGTAAAEGPLVATGLEETDALNLVDVKEATLYRYKGNGTAVWEPTVAEDKTITGGKLTLNNVTIQAAERGQEALMVPGNTTVVVQGTCVLSRGNALGNNALCGRGPLTVELAEKATLEAIGGDGATQDGFWGLCRR